ncbi:hypothetical protein ACQPZQ_15290 [Pseudonocardia sp. CA-142604]|uniref:hypothetical protein n=1 Tax=Pseudonocardia sp. CA-142604 TaxID=3240024 RepID=UPI003D89F2EE
MQEIAENVGVSRQTIRRLAEDYGITLRPKGRRRTFTIDPDWLHEQYVVKHRTLPDLAQEAGTSEATLARWAPTHHIPLRGRRGPSHQASLLAAETADAAPTLLHLAGTAAMDGNGFADSPKYRPTRPSEPPLRHWASDRPRSQPRSTASSESPWV